MNLDQSNNDISMQRFGIIKLSIWILSMWDNDKEKVEKNLQKNGKRGWLGKEESN